MPEYESGSERLEMSLIKKLRDKEYKEEHWLSHSEEAVLKKKISHLSHITGLVLTCVIFPLYYLRDSILPQFLFELADKLKMGLFFDRYLHLIEQGGVGFADRFFIAYAIVFFANALALFIATPIGCFIVRRNMVPVKQVTRLMNIRLYLALLFIAVLAAHVLGMGNSLNQLGFYRADDHYIGVMLIVAGICQPHINMNVALIMAKVFFVAYDTWRDGTFREVFFSHT